MSELVSTRDPSHNTSTYQEVLLGGLAPDGGLYVPLEYPRLGTADLKRLSNAAYTELFTDVKSSLVGKDMPSQVIWNIARQAYSQENFPDAVGGNITPVSHICGNFYIQNLSLGPTAAFKDMALQSLAREMDYVLRQRGERLTLLGATSGDTGSAAEAAAKNLGTLSLFMLSPKYGMSVFQKAQMGALTGENIYNISIDAPFSPCQDIVKELPRDPEFEDLGAVNSINWGRIASQVPYFVSGYLQAIKMSGASIGDPIDFVVPSGNFGNMLAGYIARKMGVPVRRLIVATNENNVLHGLVQRGEYRYKKTIPTSSPSMDISEASNFERLLYDLMDGDTAEVSAFMRAFRADGITSFADFGLSPQSLRAIGFDSGSSSTEDRLESIRWVYKQAGIIIDPHTADAVTVARQKNSTDEVPIVSMATALPVKFEDTVREALGFVPPRSERFVGIEDTGAGGFVELDLSTEAVKQYIRKHR